MTAISSTSHLSLTMPDWCVVTGLGSGKYLDGVHRVDVNRPFGKMTTFCGIVISSAFRESRPHPDSQCRVCSRRTSAP